MPKFQSISGSIGNYLGLAFVVAGGIFYFYALFFGTDSYPNIVPGAFLDSLAVTLDWVSLGSLSFPIQVDNFLIFQEYQSLPPGFTLRESYLFGGIVFLVAVFVLTLVSQFKKIPFLIFGAAWIILLTLSNGNGLNVGSPSSNTPLIVLIVSSLFPVVFFHVWKPDVSFGLRLMAVFLSFGAAVLVLIQVSPIANPSLFFAEQSLILALGMSIAWMFWQGHGILSGIYLLLARVNQRVGVKISWQILGIAVLYFITLIFLLLDLKGEINLPFPTFSPLYLILPIGVLGWISTSAKLMQVEEIAGPPQLLRALFLIGFGIVFWVVWKLEISGNQAAEEFLKHLLVYSQFGFSLFLLVYLLSNFLSVMDSGKAVDKILYKPHSLPYYHLKVGGLITILVVTIYMDAVLAPQTSSMTTHILADYYYQTNQKLEASILYENAWDTYRINQKAKNATAHLLFDLNQPTLAKEHLDQSFAEAPQVDNIILHSSRMIRENRPLEAIYYLENGLRRFPDHPILANNLALVYVQIQKPKEALQLLTEIGGQEPVVLANLIAMQSKLGATTLEADESEGLISEINLLAKKDQSNDLTSQEQLEKVKHRLEKETSPMLLHAGLRNLFSFKNLDNTSDDLNWIDSVSRKAEMLDYLMDIQETASIRSLAAGRITESVKNLNGLAFRNPGDAGYYLHLTAGILAKNLDFESAARDLIVAEEKGFKAFKPYHLTILKLGGFVDKALELGEKYQIPSISEPEEFLVLLSKFNPTIPDKLFDQWNAFTSSEWKSALAMLLLERKSHGLTQFQLKELGTSLLGKVENEDKLQKFLQNPDWSDPSALLAFTEFLQVGEELNANPYLTPLVLSAADRLPDPLDQYELLNTASEFNKDPLLWIRKAQAARRIGLDNYATATLQELSNWISWDEIEYLDGTNY